mmetsp:Transcript_133386/g.231710  ORF Transcript_133386/g.231710 Transcript_133386/m.231710 type:complete len:1019 (-) Transcript_133386:147-3203(-)
MAEPQQLHSCPGRSGLSNGSTTPKASKGALRLKPIDLGRLDAILDGVVAAEREIANARSSLAELCGQPKASLAIDVESRRKPQPDGLSCNTMSNSYPNLQQRVPEGQSLLGRLPQKPQSPVSWEFRETANGCPLKASVPTSPKQIRSVGYDLHRKDWAPAIRPVSETANGRVHRHHHVLDEIVVRSLRETEKELSMRRDGSERPRVTVHGNGHHETVSGRLTMMGVMVKLNKKQPSFDGSRISDRLKRLTSRRSEVDTPITNTTSSNSCSSNASESSEGAVDIEKFRILRSIMVVQTCNGWLNVPVIHPQASLRLFWLILSFFFITVEVFAIPFYIAFDVSPAGMMFIVTSASNGYFLVDILITFFTGYMDNNGTLVMAPGRIFRNYVLTWFAMDFISAIPWDWMPSALINEQVVRPFRFARAIRLLHLIRLVRLMKMKGFAERMQTTIEASQVSMFVVSVLWILFLLFGVTHWAACIWYVIGIKDNDVRTSWLEQELAEFDINPAWTEKVYIVSLYFTLTTMTTVGYGDITPTNFREIVFVLILLLCASLIFAGLMGVLTDLITSLNSQTHFKADQKTMLTRYMCWRAVPQDLTHAIREHLTFLWETNLYDSYEQEMMKQLSPVLRAELCYHIYGHILMSTPCFSWMKDYSACVKALAQMLHSKFLEQGDHLFRRGENNDQVHVLLAGSVWLTQNENYFAKTDLVKNKSTANRAGSTFMIPRNKQVGLVDVGLGVVAKTKKVLSTRREKEKVIDVLRKFSYTKNMDLAQNRKSSVRQSESSRNSVPIKQGVLKKAATKMARLDDEVHRAATKLQRGWRMKKEREQFAASKGGKDDKVRSMHSTLVRAPTFLGESCLWTPLDTWNSSPRYAYGARCTTRVEVVIIRRTDVAEVLKQFDPWLKERLEVFQSFIQEGVDEFAEAQALESARVSSSSATIPLSPRGFASEGLQSFNFSRDSVHANLLSQVEQSRGEWSSDWTARQWELPFDDHVQAAKVPQPQEVSPTQVSEPKVSPRRSF